LFLVVVSRSWALTFRSRNARQVRVSLSPEEGAFVELKLALSEALRARRASSRLTQAQLAKRLQSSQSRVAKMESGDPSVSVDLLLRSLLMLGVSSRTIARVIGARPRRALAG
jgi:DNA-binding XRE family transcriptional regulator